MTDNRNTILAVVLSGIVLLGWQYFFNIPHMEKQRVAQQAAQQMQQAQQPAANGQPSATPQAGGSQPANAPGSTTVNAPIMTRDAAIAASPRVKIDTPRISGSISLKGGRIDDVSLVKYRETVDPNSPAVVLFEPSGAPHPYYAEFGWVGASGTTAKLPDANTVWTQQGSNALTPSTPVTLTWDNGAGLTFKRTMSIDDQYLFSIKDDVSVTVTTRARSGSVLPFPARSEPPPSATAFAAGCANW